MKVHRAAARPSFRVPCTALAALVASFGLAAPAAEAAIPDASGVIHACYNRISGNQRIIDTAVESCKNGEQAIQWSQSGPQGPQGAPGPQGPQGPAGTKGDPGSASPFHVYYAENSHEIESDSTYQQVVGLTDLPAGTYLFSVSVHSDAFCTASNCFFANLFCSAVLSGVGGLTEFVYFVGNDETDTNVILRAVSANASLKVECIKDGDAALATGRVYAIKVDMVN